MSAAPWPVLAGYPAARQWDFGGYPYALEPLTLPPTGSWQPRPDCADPRPAPVSLVADFVAPVGQAELPAPADELFWFRWITGHQVSFLLWRLIGQLTHEATEGFCDPVETFEPLRRYVRGYCGMLLYTASCPRATYERLIRPSMRLRHSAFSGSWAPDFWPVRDLLRGRRTAFAGHPQADGLVEAVKVHQLVHETVATRLVPDGVSLLRHSAVRSSNMPVLHVLYDNYFLTLRAAVGEEVLAAQLLRRLVAITRDLSVNGLYPREDADGGARPWIAAVAACEASIIDILEDVADPAVKAPGLVADVGRAT